MKLELAQVVAAWPLGATLAVAAAVQGLHAGRRRSALNEALHELRRPLQALALIGPGERPRDRSAIEASVQLAAAALERLEREVNGGAETASWAPVAVEPLLDAAVGRWQARARLADVSLSLGRRARAGATVDGDRGQLAQALDNLIVNAIEHGGPKIGVEARTCSGRLRIAVVDSGREPRPESRRGGHGGPIARLSGRRLRGHGLRVVRRVAAGHGGGFCLRARGQATEAILELPLAGRRK